MHHVYVLTCAGEIWGWGVSPAKTLCDKIYAYTDEIPSISDEAPIEFYNNPNDPARYLTSQRFLVEG